MSLAYFANFNLSLADCANLSLADFADLPRGHLSCRIKNCEAQGKYRGVSESLSPADLEPSLQPQTFLKCHIPH